MKRYFRRPLVSLLVVVGIMAGLSAYLIGCPDREPEVSVFFVEDGEQRTMPIEEYVMGVVAGEMKEDWPLDAYAAQAIIARTFTKYFIHEEGGSEHGTDISTDHEEAQAYNEEAITDSIREAVEKTRGEVITYNGEYVRAWFHAAAGGRTATAREGLNMDEDPPYIQVVDSPDMERQVDEDARSWTATFDQQEIIDALDEIGHAGVEDIEEIEVLDTGPSGRATRVSITHAEGEELVHAADFRVALDAEELRSTFLTDPVEADEDEFTFAGKGYGHGVGMSQWGAFTMANADVDPEEIVDHYFKDVEIEKKWE